MEEESTKQEDTPVLHHNDEDESPMGRTEREKNLHQIVLRLERLFITGGLRMDFLTPRFYLASRILSRLCRNLAELWSDGLQSQTGLDLSVFLLLLSIFIIIANLFLILILFVSLRLNISMFDEHERKLLQQGMAMNNSHGYAEVREF